MEFWILKKFVVAGSFWYPQQGSALEMSSGVLFSYGNAKTN